MPTDAVRSALEQLLSNALSFLIFFLLFFLLTTLAIARERFFAFLGSLAVTLLSLVVAPLRFLVAGVREVADGASGPEAAGGNRQFLLQQLLTLLRAVLIVIAIAIVAAGFSRGWKAMVPSPEMRARLAELGTARDEAAKTLAEVRLSASELRSAWASSTDEALGSGPAAVRRTGRQGEERARTAAERFRAATTLRLPEDVFGSLQAIDSPDEINEFGRRVRSDLSWARTGAVTRFTEPQLEFIATWVAGWSEAESAFLQFGSQVRQRLEAAEQRHGLIQSEYDQQRKANEWKVSEFLLAVVWALLSMLLTIWLLGVLLEATWLGVDLATNIRALRKASDARKAEGDPGEPVGRRSAGTIALLVLALASTLAGGCSSKSASKEQASVTSADRYMYVWVSGLQLRQAAASSSATIAELPVATRLVLLAGRSDASTPVAIGSVFASDHRYEVRTADNRTGWVHGSGLRTIPVQKLADAPKLTEDLSAFGSGLLVGGFETQRREVVAGGDITARAIGEGCPGYVSGAPTWVFNYQMPSRYLRVFVESADDTVLMVQIPDGRFACNDDRVQRHPLVDIGDPQAGEYRVWAGNYRAGTVAASVVVTENRSILPQ